MSDPTVFDNDDPKPNDPPATPATPSDDPFADKLGVIVNENGEPKYKDVETALDALKASQDFISQLKAEKLEADKKTQELEAELNQRASIEDFVKRVSPNAKPQDPPKTTDVPEGLSEEKVAQLIQEKLQTSQQEAAKKSNLDSVIVKLSEVHGEKTAAHIKEVATKLETTPAALKEMAMSNPKLALELLGGKPSVNSATPSQPSRTSPLIQDESNPRPTVESGKGATRGGMTQKELTDLFKKSTEYTNKRLGLN